MKTLLGITWYEFKMSLQRKGLLLIVILFTALNLYLWLDAGSDLPLYESNPQKLLSEAGQTIFFVNLFFPVIAGISAADRAVRDRQLRVREVLRATQISNFSYVLGKYLGVAASFIVIELGMVLTVSAALVVLYHWSPVFMLYSLMAVLLVSAPGLCFVTAFSLACPLVMPTRVYQILFTGYWYWGNYLGPSVLFTISQTLLNASGRFALIAFMGAQLSKDQVAVPPAYALANIAVLFACAGLALAAVIAYINMSERRV